MAAQNAIGDQGESIFSTRISQDNIFKVYFLGEKAPIVDFLVEIIDEQNPYQCFIQVKSTTLGYNKKGNLKVSISQPKLKALINRPLPTYIAGVDIQNEYVYIHPAFNHNMKITSIPINNKLFVANKVASVSVLQRLKQDIINYWTTINIDNHKTQYNSIL